MPKKVATKPHAEAPAEALPSMAPWYAGGRPATAKGQQLAAESAVLDALDILRGPVSTWRACVEARRLAPWLTTEEASKAIDRLIEQDIL